MAYKPYESRKGFDTRPMIKHSRFVINLINIPYNLGRHENAYLTKYIVNYPRQSDRTKREMFF